MKRTIRISLFALFAVAVVSLTIPAVVHAKAMKVEDALWAGGTTWDTVLTPTAFKNPPHHSVDLLFDFSMSGLTGQRSVSESYPGQPDYNGGRWWVQMVVFTAEGIAALDVDGDGVIDVELTSAEEVLNQMTLGHLLIFETATYFECPLL